MLLAHVLQVRPRFSREKYPPDATPWNDKKSYHRRRVPLPKIFITQHTRAVTVWVSGWSESYLVPPRWTRDTWSLSAIEYLDCPQQQKSYPGIVGIVAGCRLGKHGAERISPGKQNHKKWWKRRRIVIRPDCKINAWNWVIISYSVAGVACSCNKTWERQKQNGCSKISFL